MKLIEKKESSKNPELIWGAKYKLLKATDYIDAGTTVILVDSVLDDEGTLFVAGINGRGWVKPEDLQLLTDEPQKDAEITYTIEFTESELQAVTDFIGNTSWIQRRGIAVESGKSSGEAQHIATETGQFYSEITDILQGEF